MLQVKGFNQSPPGSTPSPFSSLYQSTWECSVACHHSSLHHERSSLVTLSALLYSAHLASLVAQMVKSLPAVWETRVRSLGQEVPLSSVQFSSAVVSDSLQTRGLQHARLPCPSPTWSLLKLMSIKSVMPSNHLILCCPLLLLPSVFPSVRVFSKSQFVTSGGQSIGVSGAASVLSTNI